MSDTSKHHTCADCAWRKKYDERPKSFPGRLWKWHTKWCPGWKAYQKSLQEQADEEN